MLELIGFEAGQNLEAALGPYFRVDGVASQRYGASAEEVGCLQGLISMSVLWPVISQMSIMSELDTAIQPLVQSWVR